MRHVRTISTPQPSGEKQIETSWGGFGGVGANADQVFAELCRIIAAGFAPGSLALFVEIGNVGIQS
jgi:hypothetical protein